MGPRQWERKVTRLVLGRPAPMADAAKANRDRSTNIKYLRPVALVFMCGVHFTRPDWAVPGDFGFEIAEAGPEEALT